MENIEQYGDKEITFTGLEDFDFYGYLKKAMETCQPQCFSEDYLELGLISEVGEIAGKLKRVIRDNYEIDKDDMSKELGDVLWYAVVLSNLRGDKFDYTYIDPDGKNYTVHIQLCQLLSAVEGYISLSDVVGLEDIIGYIDRLSNSLGFKLQEVADINIKKLADRKNRDKINGWGDVR